jgi:hypothetical protein
VENGSAVPVCMRVQGGEEMGASSAIDRTARVCVAKMRACDAPVESGEYQRRYHEMCGDARRLVKQKCSCSAAAAADVGMRSLRVSSLFAHASVVNRSPKCCFALVRNCSGPAGAVDEPLIAPGERDGGSGGFFPSTTPPVLNAEEAEALEARMREAGFLNALRFTLQ